MFGVSGRLMQLNTIPNYYVIYDDPDHLDEPTKILIPSSKWVKRAMEGELPPIWVFWDLQDDEAKSTVAEEGGRFVHDKERYSRQGLHPPIGKLTEEQAMEYLCMKELPRKCWAQEHNRPMFKIVKKNQIPSDRTFRNAWEMAV